MTYSSIIEGIVKKIGDEIIKGPIKSKKNFEKLQDLFFDLVRSRCKEDAFLKKNGPLEFKSELEMYKNGRHSRAHLVSFINQCIYGQCYNYANLHGCNSAILVIPKIFYLHKGQYKGDKGDGCDVEIIFKKCLQEQSIYLEEMQLSSIETFGVSKGKEKEKYEIIKFDGCDYLIVKIVYIPIS